MRKIIILFLLLGMVMTGGCWDWRIIDELAIIFGIAVDMEEDGMFKMTFAYPIFEQDAEEVKVNTTIMGDSLHQSLINLQHQSEQRPVLGRVSVLIFSEEAARNGGMHQILRQFDQSRDNNPNAYICVVRGSTAQEVLNLKLPQQPRVAVFLDNMLMENNIEGRLPAVFATTYWTQYHTAGVTPVIPVIELIGPKEDEKSGIRLEGLAVIDDKGRLQGYLSDTETIMYMMLTNNMQRGQFYTQVDFHKEGKKNVTVFIQKSSAKIASNIRDDRVFFTIKAEVVLDGLSFDLDEGSVLQKEVITELEQLLARDIQGNMRRVLQKSQNWEADIMGLGQYVRSQQGQWFKGKDWGEEFGKSAVNLEVKVQVKRIGSLIDPTY